MDELKRKRLMALDAIWGEAEHGAAKHTPETVDSGGVHEIGAWVTFMDTHLREAQGHISRASTSGPDFALDSIRKVAAMALTCLAQNGVRMRQTIGVNPAKLAGDLLDTLDYGRQVNMILAGASRCESPAGLHVSPANLIAHLRGEPLGTPAAGCHVDVDSLGWAAADFIKLAESRHPIIMGPGGMVSVPLERLQSLARRFRGALNRPLGPVEGTADMTPQEAAEEAAVAIEAMGEARWIEVVADHRHVHGLRAKAILSRLRALAASKPASTAPPPPESPSPEPKPALSGDEARGEDWAMAATPTPPSDEALLKAVAEFAASKGAKSARVYRGGRLVGEYLITPEAPRDYLTEARALLNTVDWPDIISRREPFDAIFPGLDRGVFLTPARLAAHLHRGPISGARTGPAEDPSPTKAVPSAAEEAVDRIRDLFRAYDTIGGEGADNGVLERIRGVLHLSAAPPLNKTL